MSDFGQSLVVEIIGGLVAGIVVALAAYLVIEQRLHLRRGEESRQHMLRAILGVIAEELEYDDDQARTLKAHAPKGELPVPLFDVNGWSLISQVSAVTAPDPKLLENLVKLYNRLRTANDLHATGLDLLSGSTAAIVASVALTAPGQHKQNAAEAFEQHKEDVFTKLFERVSELEPLLHETLDLVRRERDRLAA